MILKFKLTYNLMLKVQYIFHEEILDPLSSLADSSNFSLYGLEPRCDSHEHYIRVGYAILGYLLTTI